MKRLFFALGFFLLTHAASAQSLPDRSRETAAVVGQHLDLVVQGDDGKRQVLPYICAALNVLDAGNWGLLVKEDRGGFIPGDIIVWRPTLEHVDVLTDTGPSWIPKGPIASTWRWQAAPPVIVPPVVTPPNPPPVGDDFVTRVYAKLQELATKADIDNLKQTVTNEAVATRGQEQGNADAIRGDVKSFREAVWSWGKKALEYGIPAVLGWLAKAKLFQ